MSHGPAIGEEKKQSFLAFSNSSIAGEKTDADAETKLATSFKMFEFRCSKRAKSKCGAGMSGSICMSIDSVPSPRKALRPLQYSQARYAVFKRSAGESRRILSA